MPFKQIIKTTFIFSFIVLMSSIFASTANAAIAEKVHTRTFTLEEESVLVQESKKTTVIEFGYQVPKGSPEGFTIFNPVEGDPEGEYKLQKTLESIKVTDINGTELEFEIEQTESNNYIVKVPHPTRIGNGESSEVFLTYRSYGLIINTGAVKDLYIPGFPVDYVFEDNRIVEKINTKVIIPNTFEEINFTSPKQEIITTDAHREINIPQNDLVGNSIWVQIGTKQYFTFEIKQTIPRTNSVPFAINTFSLPIPRDVSSGPITQKVYYDTISPAPFAIYMDDDQNLIAEFKTSASQEESIYIKGYAILEQNPDFNFESAGSLSDVSEELERYLQPGRFWEVDDSLIAETVETITDSEDIYTIIQETYDFVIDRIDYSFVKKYGLNERKGALATLNGGAAVCMEYSDLFITLLRAQGVPARAAFGFGYGAADYESRSENRINHQWAEVYLPKQDTWINVDTTWGDFGNNLIGGDLNHFYSHVASVDPETPSTSELSYFGSLESIPERDMTIYIVSNIDEKNSSKTQEELLSEYKKASGLNLIAYLINQQARIFDNGINSFLEKQLNLDLTHISFSGKLLLCCLLPIVITTTVFLFIRRKRRLRIEMTN